MPDDLLTKLVFLIVVLKTSDCKKYTHEIEWKHNVELENEKKSLLEQEVYKRKVKGKTN